MLGLPDAVQLFRRLPRLMNAWPLERVELLF